MAIHLIYPAIAVLAIFVLIVIKFVLTYGSQMCRLRHNTFSDQGYWNQDEAYEQKVSYA